MSIATNFSSGFSRRISSFKLLFATDRSVAAVFKFILSWAKTAELEDSRNLVKPGINSAFELFMSKFSPVVVVVIVDLSFILLL